MANVLVLGAAGFIGFHLSRYIADEGHQVTLCDNFMRGKQDLDFANLLSAPNVRFVEADLTQLSSFNLFNEHYDEIYLLASVVGVRNAETQPHEVMRINTNITHNTLTWAKDQHHNIGKILYASTSEVYAGGVSLGHVPVPTPEQIPLTIEDIRNPRFSYAISKLWGEACCLHYANAYALKISIVRYHNIYGPRMGFAHVIPELLMRILNGENPLTVYGVDQSRAFCFVSDAVKASIKVMRSGQTNGEIVHIGNDTREILISELLEQLLNIASVRPQLSLNPAPEGSVKRRCPDITKLRQFTGFAPEISLNEGLVKTFEWYSNYFTKELRDRQC
ncbi:NAD-dependent epimerase/dehydratase family protein [Candidatus Poribacteria bacterium]|nr:NAD-dependent epimerase/dehydratase family protein [Candidatus Poribacteria bacterium]